QQSLSQSKLAGPGKLVGFLPGRVTPGAPMRRRTIGLFQSIDLPDSVGSIGVPRRATQHAGPEHEPLNFLAAGFGNALITNLAIDHWHRRRLLKRLRHPADGVRYAVAVAVSGLQHIEIEYGESS